MKVLPFKIPKTIDSSLRVQIDRQPYFYDTLHQHPELQITLILKGTGTLFQGEYIGEYRPGDVFVIGANIPHVLKSDAVHYNDETSISHAISIFFTRQCFGSSFFELPEMSAVHSMLEQTNRGIQLLGRTKTKTGQLIKEMTQLPGAEKIIGLLQVLNNIALSTEINFLTENYSSLNIDEAEGARLNTILQFTLKEHHRPIRLEEVAEMAYMTVPAFCRYFKLRTRKTYINFLNEVRIAQACKLLLSGDDTVVQIAFHCGFGNISHFNRVFKKIQGITPKEFRYRGVNIIS